MFLINFNQWKCACVGLNNWVIGLYINEQETGVLYLSDTCSFIHRKEYSFGLSESKIPMKLFALQREINREGEKCIKKNFSICILQQLPSWTKPEDSGARNM